MAESSMSYSDSTIGLPELKVSIRASSSRRARTRSAKRSRIRPRSWALVSPPTAVKGLLGRLRPRGRRPAHLRRGRSRSPLRWRDRRRRRSSCWRLPTNLPSMYILYEITSRLLVGMKPMGVYGTPYSIPPGADGNAPWMQRGRKGNPLRPRCVVPAGGETTCRLCQSPPSRARPLRFSRCRVRP